MEPASQRAQCHLKMYRPPIRSGNAEFPSTRFLSLAKSVVLMSSTLRPKRRSSSVNSHRIISKTVGLCIVLQNCLESLSVAAGQASLNSALTQRDILATTRDVRTNEIPANDNLNFILLLPHSSVNSTVPLQQLFVPSLFRYYAVLEHNDHIGVGNRFQSVVASIASVASSHVAQRTKERTDER